jgi:hypothetical protein
MKKMFFIVMLFLGFVQGAYAWTLQTGTYDLSGGNTSWSGYRGEVVIAPQGENYSVVWRVGTKQAQIGIGILQDDILSVAFTDLSNNSFWGVASYRVRPFGSLEGVWTSADGTVQKPEYLSWKNYSIY